MKYASKRKELERRHAVKKQKEDLFSLAEDIINPKKYENCMIGLKFTKLLLNRWVLSIAGDRRLTPF